MASAITVAQIHFRPPDRGGGPAPEIDQGRDLQDALGADSVLTDPRAVDELRERGADLARR